MVSYFVIGLCYALFCSLAWWSVYYLGLIGWVLVIIGLVAI